MQCRGLLRSPTFTAQQETDASQKFAELCGSVLQTQIHLLGTTKAGAGAEAGEKGGKKTHAWRRNETNYCEGEQGGLEHPSRTEPRRPGD